MNNLKCPFCNVQFNTDTINKLTNNKLLSHNEKYKFKCPDCKKNILLKFIVHYSYKIEKPNCTEHRNKNHIFNLTGFTILKGKTKDIKYWRYCIEYKCKICDTKHMEFTSKKEFYEKSKFDENFILRYYNSIGILPYNSTPDLYEKEADDYMLQYLSR